MNYYQAITYFLSQLSKMIHNINLVLEQNIQLIEQGNYELAKSKLEATKKILSTMEFGLIVLLSNKSS